jgi:SAM-dependent methyltransferase
VNDAPSSWLVSHAPLLPPGGAALDVACGRGRHTWWLAARGWRVHAIDRSEESVRAVNERAQQEGLDVRADVIDLEVPHAPLPRQAYDLVVVVHYLHRPLFPELLASLRSGALLVYETFTRAQASRGRPTNPAFLLESGELPRLVQPLEIVDQREGDVEGRWVASVVARKRP